MEYGVGDVSIAATAVVCKTAVLEGNIRIGKGTVLHPKCRVIAEGGPIHIGSNNIVEELACIHNRSTTGETLEIGDNNAIEIGAGTSSLSLSLSLSFASCFLFSFSVFSLLVLLSLALRSSFSRPLFSLCSPFSSLFSAPFSPGLSSLSAHSSSFADLTLLIVVHAKRIGNNNVIEAKGFFFVSLFFLVVCGLLKGTLFLFCCALISKTGRRMCDR
ncbi:Dynactin subunit 6 [Balamuthia mandrillaris]